MDEVRTNKKGVTIQSTCVRKSFIEEVTISLGLERQVGG